ncbi:matrixin family metalloprotease [Dermatobacter hominis]|uniref:matrixin family metalloprotease n=1 Tax=Dermatobacter hominis TaxID=2884263 RepID=UPI001D105680|nr:matrixin family metalloprotease [Dermatobacter hominis]UDY37936.1 matrixin family metalloprotease [Dermatobacter hominis]
MRVPRCSTGRVSSGWAALRRTVAADVAALVAIAGLALCLAACGGEPGGGVTAVPRPSGWPSAPSEEWTVPMGSPPAVPTEQGPFAFVAHQPDGTSPVAWDPCRPIHFVVNPTDGPEDQEELIDDAVARVSEATGLQFVDDGTTDETWSRERDSSQPDRYGDRWAPVLITWAHESTAPVLRGPVAGRGGASGVRLPGGDEFVYVTGSIVLDAVLAKTASSEPGATAVRALIQHELGHVVGLDHVDDPDELMHTESLPDEYTDWGPGDREGLARLGAGRCFPDI